MNICESCVNLAQSVVEMVNEEAEVRTDDPDEQVQDILLSVLYLESEFAKQLGRPETGYLAERVDSRSFWPVIESGKRPESWTEKFSVEDVARCIESLETVKFGDTANFE